MNRNGHTDFATQRAPAVAPVRPASSPRAIAIAFPLLGGNLPALAISLPMSRERPLGRALLPAAKLPGSFSVGQMDVAPGRARAHARSAGRIPLTGHRGDAPAQAGRYAITAGLAQQPSNMRRPDLDRCWARPPARHAAADVSTCDVRSTRAGGPATPPRATVSPTPTSEALSGGCHV